MIVMTVLTCKDNEWLMYVFFYIVSKKQSQEQKAQLREIGNVTSVSWKCSREGHWATSEILLSPLHYPVLLDMVLLGISRIYWKGEAILPLSLRKSSELPKPSHSLESRKEWKLEEVRERESKDSWEGKLATSLKPGEPDAPKAARPPRLSR